MKSATVLGCGIVGLTTAIKLQEAGWKVRIIARECFNATLSSKVGAIWFPFEVYPREKANYWARLTYKEYLHDRTPGNGVSFIPFITAYNEDTNLDWTQEMPEGTTRQASKQELPEGFQNALISRVPLAEPQRYLAYLFKRFTAKKGTFIQRNIESLKEVSKLDSLVINCTGLGAKELCNDEDLHAMRGQILRCKKMSIPSCADSTRKGALFYVINRSEDCVIGGTDYINDYNLEVDQKDTEQILDRFTKVGISNSKPEIIEEVVGLRPKRSEVRFEFDKKYPWIFHNYGHGGAGFTVAWGCAIDIARQINL
ncbi:FAD-binding oxidoreductase [Gramella sp. GC03-9]|uniref:D-amino-acid oxidase n=1 Tax=Christiangramia oceanisediminis TaxID=2920386 RepID=A0A9X2R9K6_9FLAO|nr:FAD-dependent oxidoreductase [Gramella oceanisediminis]MCP9200873.1 FAD-binding oxidoreductase [Gramella oceanisediminis]